MGMSTYVIGFVYHDNNDYKKHEKVLIACLEAGIEELPKETAKFFGSKFPRLSLLDSNCGISLPVCEYKNECSGGLELLVSAIPKSVYKIRFVNSW